MTDNQNPPAYPLTVPMGQRMTPGMTLLDHFAGLAMQGICASGTTDDWTNERIVADAYDMASLMLIERQKWIK